jgi:hypothetical protein
MTEDPVKLYVVVMAILVCVLGWVAHSSYEKAAAFEAAIAAAPAQAKEMKAYAQEVGTLCEQLSGSKVVLGGNFLTLIEEAAEYNRVRQGADLREDNDKRIGAKGVERRFKFGIPTAGPVKRETVARFCQQVERDSRNILKTIEISLRRHTGGGGGVPAGENVEGIVDDTYTGTIIFGLRVVKQ